MKVTIFALSFPLALAFAGCSDGVTQLPSSPLDGGSSTIVDAAAAVDLGTGIPDTGPEDTGVTLPDAGTAPLACEGEWKSLVYTKDGPLVSLLSVAVAQDIVAITYDSKNDADRVSGFLAFYDLEGNLIQPREAIDAQSKVLATSSSFLVGGDTGLYNYPFDSLSPTKVLDQAFFPDVDIDGKIYGRVYSNGAAFNFLPATFAPDSTELTVFDLSSQSATNRAPYVFGKDMILFALTDGGRLHLRQYQIKGKEVELAGNYPLFAFDRESGLRMYPGGPIAASWSEL